MTLTGALALVAVVAAIGLVLRGWDVRLVLLAAAFATAGLGGDVRPVCREFLGTFSNEKFVVPICSAMGFAYVLRHTGCDRHLVLLLVRPIRRVRGLLVPGAVAVGFLVNIPVISQTSTAVCLGPVVVPLLRAGGYSPATTGACLLLGASVGGELLNPGAPELLTVYDRTQVPPLVQAQVHLPPLVFTQLVVSGLVLWAMSWWWERRPAQEAANAQDAPETVVPVARIDPIRAVVPLVPLVLLFLTGPPFGLFSVPTDWLAKSGEEKLAPSRLIGLAMLIGVLAAAAAVPRTARDCVGQFFTGAGQGFATIVSLIVTANCFGEGIKTAGLAAVLGETIAASPGLLWPLAAAVPLAFAALSGSGMASTQSLFAFFDDPARDLGLDRAGVGAPVAVASAAGRTMSPVAAVVLMCGTLTGADPVRLAKRVAVPLLVGTAVVLGLRMSGTF